MRLLWGLVLLGPLVGWVESDEDEAERESVLSPHCPEEQVRVHGRLDASHPCDREKMVAPLSP